MTFDRLAYPWLLFFGLSVLILLIAWAIRGRRGATLLYSGEAWAESIGGGWRAALAWLPGLLRVCVLLLLTVAIARPQDSKGEKRTQTEGVALQIVIDRSSSMREAIDQYGNENRLDAVKRLAADFVSGGKKSDDTEDLRGRQGDLIGIISFARYADTVCPLVQSYEPLLDQLARIQMVQIREEDGTAIGDALALAAARLKNAETEINAEVPRNNTPSNTGSEDARDEGPVPDFKIASKAIILMTDGIDNASQYNTLGVADLCKKWGIKIYAIGIGSDPSNAPSIGGFRFATGPNVDERMLRALAEATEGRYWLATNADALEEIYAEIDSLEKTEIETSEYTQYEERFVPFAVLAAALLALEVIGSTLVFRRAP